MITTVTKEEFERALPVGTSAHESVYSMLLPEIEERMRTLGNVMLGDEGAAMLDAEDEKGVLHVNFIRLAVVSAFLGVLRQMDLVLTPTGFGVVANDNVSPASKQRVDALERQLRTTQYKSRALLLNALRSERWGATPQAKAYIPTLYDEYEFFIVRRIEDVDVQDWLKLQQPIREADIMLRSKASNAQVDAVTDAYRRNDTEAMGRYADVVAAIRDFFSVWCLTGTQAAADYPLRRIVAAMERPDKAEVYAEYLNSDEYKTNHHEVFQNTDDSTAYLFNG